MSTELVSLETQIANLDKIAEDKNLVALQQGGQFAAAFGMADAIKTIRMALTEQVMAPIMELQGTPLGFRTDKDSSGGYKVDVVKEALIEATFRGFKPVGNQFNIIASRFYATKEGYEAQFRTLATRGKIKDLKLRPSVPKKTGDGAIVTYAASWVWQGTPDSIENFEIPVRVNSGMGDDAILGKAKRKILAAIFSRITGTETPDGDVNEPAIDIDAKPPAAAEKVKLPADVLGTIEEMLKPHEELANAYLIGNGSIQKGETFRNVPEAMARKILKQAASFITAIGVKAGG